ncbi:phytanoyl-CoA dioxygenase family protein [Streptomyces hydrogenans]|uniref:phytanoyl-CoA dioxygenase family protein n=1 Tax=Streptomyces TaxID=1883 RepID=UPI0024B7B336|nr:phytanoyl-CoA dioxygenase family protein [Streptomyces sp. HNM0645]MDI9885561.1 phytanoyl-CoA dioxygenase family protein [Streptomyces sp. HNM0645]
MAELTAHAPLTESFARDGYAILPGVLDRETVAGLRELCGRLLTGEGKQEMLPRTFLATPELTDVLLRDEITAALTRVLGPRVAFYPNLTIRKSLYIGWHIDEAFAGPGKEYVWDPGFAHLQGAIYLQDNDERTGGGIDVLPGSHLASIDGYGRARPDFDSALANPPGGRPPVRVDSKAGDLVLWHARLMHASTPAAGPEDGDAPTKLGLFFSAGRHDAYENNRFLSHLTAKRVQVEDGKQVFYERHGQVLDIRYPESYPHQVRQRAADAGVTFASF